MTAEISFLNRAVAFGSAVVYWSGVWLQARRVRRWIGRSPNVKPRGRKEKMLWAGWFAVVGLWLSIPWLAGRGALGPLAGMLSLLVHPASTGAGIGLMAAGYAGTLWSYSAMGRHWRMGIREGEPITLVTHGPFRFVRHPIYVFQVVMLTGLVLLLPTPLSFIAVAVHLFCVVIKVADEESFLAATLGTEFREYRSRTGKLIPRFRWKKAEPTRPDIGPGIKCGLPPEDGRIDSPRV